VPNHEALRSGNPGTRQKHYLHTPSLGNIVDLVWQEIQAENEGFNEILDAFPLSLKITQKFK